MTPKYDGPGRRRSDVDSEHRLTILESIAESNKKGIEAIHARLSKFDHEQKSEVRILGESIKDAFANLQERKCEVHEKRLTALEAWRNLIVGAGTGIMAWWKWGDKVTK